MRVVMLGTQIGFFIGEHQSEKYFRDNRPAHRPQLRRGYFLRRLDWNLHESLVLNPFGQDVGPQRAVSRKTRIGLRDGLQRALGWILHSLSDQDFIVR